MRKLKNSDDARRHRHLDQVARADRPRLAELAEQEAERDAEEDDEQGPPGPATSSAS